MFTFNCQKLSSLLLLNRYSIVICNVTFTLNCPKLLNPLSLNCYAIVIYNTMFTLKMSEITQKFHHIIILLSKIIQNCSKI